MIVKAFYVPISIPHDHGEVSEDIEVVYRAAISVHGDYQEDSGSYEGMGGGKDESM